MGEARYPAGCAKCAALQAQLDAVCSADPCPECGCGVTATCYGCALKAEQERSKALAAVLRAGLELTASWSDVRTHDWRNMARAALGAK